jgi:signal transduction histidine kinase
MQAKTRLRGKLRNKIFLLMALVSVVPVLTAASLSIYSIRTAHKTDVAAIEATLLNQKYEEIEGFMRSELNSFRTKYATDKTEDIDLNTKKILLKQKFDTMPAVDEIASVSLAGFEVVKFDRLHPNGVDQADLKNVGDTEAFLSAKNGNDYISDITFTPDGPVVEVSSPVKNQNGVVLSVIDGVLSLREVQLAVQSAKLGNSGYLYLVDGKGNLVGGGLGVAPGANMKGIGIINGVLSGQDFIGADAQGRYKNVFGEEVVAAGRYIPEYKWGLVAEWPTAEADAVINDLIYKNALISILVFLIAVLLSVIFATLIVRPILSLEEGTQRVAKGEFDTEVNIKTGDELEELGAAFNEMMAGLKQLNELKDEFVFIAAHELRTPVAAIKGYLSLVLDGVTGPITEKTKEFVQKVINSNQRLIQLVNDLLEVSRSEAGKLAIKVSQIDIVQPIKETLAELQPLADKQSISLVYEPPHDVPKIMADAARIKEVMVNLVGNAVKYNNPGGSVWITHEIQGNNLVTHISDNGFGISKEAQAKLFEKFYRVVTDKTKDITGTGLGLFIVKEIIEKMNGKIWAESEGEGRGSTFSFSLPIA